MYPRDGRRYNVFRIHFPLARERSRRQNSRPAPARLAKTSWNSHEVAHNKRRPGGRTPAGSDDTMQGARARRDLIAHGNNSSFASCLSAPSCWRSPPAPRRADGLVFRPRPARLPAARQLRAADHDAGSRRRRQAAGRIRHRAAGVRADRGDPEARHRRLPVGRGQEFLQPSRGRPDLDAARRADRSRALGQQPAAGRRLDDHAAGREKHAAVERGVDRAQDQGERCSRPASSRRCRRTASSNSI